LPDNGQGYPEAGQVFPALEGRLRLVQQYRNLQEDIFGKIIHYSIQITGRKSPVKEFAVFGSLSAWVWGLKKWPTGPVRKGN